jgi:hypothetical protein
MIAASILAFAAQQTLSVDELLSLPWEGNQQFIYQQVLDDSVNPEIRARLAEYAIVFDGHVAIDAFAELLSPETTPTLLHALLREWRSCVRAGDKELLLELAATTQPRTAYLALRNLAKLSETARDYIPLIELAVQRDIELAQRLLTYLPHIKDDGTFRDYLTAQLSSANFAYRGAMLNKVAEYHTADSFLELYTRRVSESDIRRQAEWMPSIARMSSAACNLVATQWFWDAQEPMLFQTVAAVAKALESCDMIDSNEDMYMRHSLLSYEQSCGLLMARVASSEAAADFAVEHFDDFPRAWQKIILDKLTLNPTLRSIRLSNTVARSLRYSEGVRAAAVRSRTLQHGDDVISVELTQLLNDEWSSYELAEALIEFAITKHVNSPHEIVALIDGQVALSSMRQDLLRALYRYCAESNDSEVISFIAERWPIELRRVQQQNPDLINMASLASVSRVDGNFNEILSSLVCHSSTNDTQLMLSLPEAAVDENGAVLLIFAAARLRKGNPQLANKFLTAALSSLGKDNISWQVIACSLGSQLEQASLALPYLEQLLGMPAAISLYEFAIRETFAPEAAGWHEIDLGIAHRELFARAAKLERPQLCRELLTGQIESELLLRASEMCSTYQFPRRQDVLTLSVALAQHAVDLSPYSTEAHQQLVYCNRIAQVDDIQNEIAIQRLERLQTNR